MSSKKVVGGWAATHFSLNLLGGILKAAGFEDGCECQGPAKHVIRRDDSANRSV